MQIVCGSLRSSTFLSLQFNVFSGRHDCRASTAKSSARWLTRAAVLYVCLVLWVTTTVRRGAASSCEQRDGTAVAGAGQRWDRNPVSISSRRYVVRGEGDTIMHVTSRAELIYRHISLEEILVSNHLEAYRPRSVPRTSSLSLLT